MLTLHVHGQEARISEELFARLALLPLIDRYHAYQILDNHWQPISTDLEILQTEGFDASRMVDPNLVTKKKDGKDVEVQDGWKGRIMPFELVQMTYLKKDLDALHEKETRLSEITASIEETLESFNEEEKSGDSFSDEGDKFVSAAVTKEAKALLAEAKKSSDFAPESYEAKIIQVAEWLANEKTLKSAIKQAAAALHLKTKQTIEGLSDAQVRELLERKWIVPLSDELHRLPDQQIDGLIGKLEALVEKYRITYADNAREIQLTEIELAGLIDELDGNEFDLKGLAELKTLLISN
jgi:type I restriction enzyme M protein